MSGSQMQGKFVEDSAITAAKIASNAVDQTKILIANDQFIRMRNAANSADVNTMKLNASDRIEFDSMPQSSATPSAANDLVNKSYADSLVGGAGVSKKAVHFVVTGAGDPLVVGTGSSYDGYTPSSGDRFLYIGSFDSDTERGIYQVTGAATSVRASDADLASEFEFGQMVTVKSGNVYAGAQMVLMTSAAITLGTTVLDYRRLNEWNYEILTLVSGDITNGYIDLAFKAQPFSIQMYVNGSRQFESAEFTVSISGGVSRVVFAGNLATGGPSALVASDEVRFQYVKAF